MPLAVGVQGDSDGDECQDARDGGQGDDAELEPLLLVLSRLCDLRPAVLRVGVCALDVTFNERHRLGLLGHQALDIRKALVNLVHIRRYALRSPLPLSHLFCQQINLRDNAHR